jgi:hypothetical protein
MTITTPTKFDTLVDLIKNDHANEAYDVLRDITSLTADEKTLLLDALRGKQLHFPKVVNGFWLWRHLLNLGIDQMQIEIGDNANWPNPSRQTVIRLIDTIRLKIELEDLSKFALPILAEEDDMLDIEFEHVAIFEWLDTTGESPTSTYGVPYGGYVDWTANTKVDVGRRRVYGLHFVLLPRLGEPYLQDGDEALKLSLTADVVVLPDGRLKQFGDMSYPS